MSYNDNDKPTFDIYNSYCIKYAKNHLREFLEGEELEAENVEDEFLNLYMHMYGDKVEQDFIQDERDKQADDEYEMWAQDQLDDKAEEIGDD